MVEVTNIEKNLPYYKYFVRELAEMPKESLAIAAGAPADPAMILAIEDRNKFLAGEDTGIERGFGVAANGTGYVANKLFMPGVTVEMMEWWFGWHPSGSDLRYKLWDHDAHYYARVDEKDYVLNPDVPVSQKTWGVTHRVLEDIGFGPAELILHFKKPSDFGYDMNLVGSKYCNSLVCAIGEGDSPAFMTHKFYAVEGGTMLESRFWMGYGFIDGQFVKLLPDGVSIPAIAPQKLFCHGIEEFSNLASILPELYAEEKDNWID